MRAVVRDDGGEAVVEVAAVAGPFGVRVAVPEFGLVRSVVAGVAGPVEVGVVLVLVRRLRAVFSRIALAIAKANLGKLFSAAIIEKHR